MHAVVEYDELAAVPDESSRYRVRHHLSDGTMQVLLPQLGRNDIDVKTDQLYILHRQ